DLRRGREVFLDVQLADRIAKGGAGRADRALPALALRGRALQGLAEEIEAQFLVRLRQQRRRGVQGVERQQGLPRVDRLAADQFRFAGDRGRLPQVDPFHAIQAGRLEVRVPVEARCLFREFGDT